MGILSTKLKSKKVEMKKNRPLGSVGDSLPVATGFNCIDYELCSYFKSAEDGQKYLYGGINMGKLALFVGSSQSGKTTLALQMANNIASDLNGDVVVFDYERASNNLKSRVMAICGIDEEIFEERFTVFDSENLDITALKNLIGEIVKVKQSLTKDQLVDWYDEELNPIKIYPPTIIIIDSIAHMRGVDQIEDTNNMTAATVGRLNSDLVTYALNVMAQYNITIFGINHIKKKIITNIYAKNDPVLPGLEKDENLPGGQVWAYDASYAFRLYSGGAAMKKDKDYKVDGREVEMRILKSRISFNNKRISLALTSKLGFFAPLSDLMTLQDRMDKVKGTGTSGFYLDIDPELKWKKSTFLTSYLTDDSFKERMDANVVKVYEEYAKTNNDMSIVEAKSTKTSKATKAAAAAFLDDDEDDDI